MLKELLLMCKEKNVSIEFGLGGIIYLKKDDMTFKSKSIDESLYIVAVKF